MKFNVPAKQLHSLVAAVSKIINSKNAIQILNNFLLTLEGDCLTILASDMENSLMARLTVTQPEGEGSFCIDARRLVDLLKEIPDVGISFEIHEDTLNVDITYPNGRYNLVAINGDEYPKTPDMLEDAEELIAFNAPAENIIRGIDYTFFAVSTDTLRPMMTGILWDIKENGLIFVATDTRRLVRFIDRNIRSGKAGKFIFPAKSAQVFKNAFAKEGDVDITCTTKGVVLKTDTYTFNSVLIKGNFPPYDRVIPTNNPYAMTIDRMSFMTAVRRVGSFIAGDNGLVKFTITPEHLTIRAIDNNYCLSAREGVPCSFNGSEMNIGFNAPFLIEMLNVVPTSEVIVELTDPSRPGVIIPSENSANTDLLMLLMPMTVNE